MEITSEDREELKRLVEISKNQIPNYVNLINPARNDWNVENLEDCVFGMVFHKYMGLSNQFLTNKMIDDKETENTLETFDVSLAMWGDHVPEIKHAISEASKT